MFNFIQKTVLSTLVFLLPLMGNAQTCRTDIIPSTPTNQFIDNGNGTVTDTGTGLMWKRCAENQVWDGSNCKDILYPKPNEIPPIYLDWMSAIEWAQSVNSGTGGRNLGYTDWRVPNIKELNSIVEDQCYGPSINSNVFPNSPWGFWSASPDGGTSAWRVNFYYGDAETKSKNDGYTNVRLVRNGY